MKTPIRQAEQGRSALLVSAAQPRAPQAYQRQIGQHHSQQGQPDQRQPPAPRPASRPDAPQGESSSGQQRQRQQRHPGRLQRQRFKTVSAGAPQLARHEPPEIALVRPGQAHGLAQAVRPGPARQAHLQRRGQQPRQGQRRAAAHAVRAQRLRRHAPGKQPPAAAHDQSAHSARHVGKPCQQPQGQHARQPPAASRRIGPGAAKVQPGRPQQRQQGQGLVIGQVLLAPVAAGLEHEHREGKRQRLPDRLAQRPAQQPPLQPEQAAQHAQHGKRLIRQRVAAQPALGQGVQRQPHGRDGVVGGFKQARRGKRSGLLRVVGPPVVQKRQVRAPAQPGQYIGGQHE